MILDIDGSQYKLECEDLVKIIEKAKNIAYRKVNEELILMYMEVGKFIYEKLLESKYGDKVIYVMRLCQYC